MVAAALAVSGGCKSFTVGALMSCFFRDPCAGTRVEGNTPSGKLNQSWASQSMQRELFDAHLQGIDHPPCVACRHANLGWLYCHDIDVDKSTQDELAARRNGFDLLHCTACCLAGRGCSCRCYVDFADDLTQNEQSVAHSHGSSCLPCVACCLAGLGCSHCNFDNFVDNLKQNEPPIAQYCDVAHLPRAACCLACHGCLCCHDANFVDENTKGDSNLQKYVANFALFMRPLIPRRRDLHGLVNSCRRELPVELNAGALAHLEEAQPTAQAYEWAALARLPTAYVVKMSLTTDASSICRVCAVAPSTATGSGTSSTLGGEAILAGGIIHLMAFMPGIAHSSIKQSDGE